MLEAGFNESEGLVLLINNGVVSEQDWDRPMVQDSDDIRVLAAFEGG